MSAAAPEPRKSPKAAAQTYVPRHRRQQNAQDEPASSTTPSASSSRTASPVPPEASATTAAPDGPTRKGRGPFRSPGPPQKPGRGSDRRTREPPVRVYPARKQVVPGRTENGSAAGAASEGEGRARGGESDAQQQQPRQRAKTADASLSEVADGVQTLTLDEERANESHDASESTSLSSLRGQIPPGEPTDEDEWDTNLPPTSKDVPKAVPLKTHRPVGDYMEESNTCALDVYDFPAAFKTHDLDLIFEGQQGGRRGGYTIKWMGDTRAVIVFQHPDSAKAAYAHALGNPFIRIKPYAGEILRDATDRPRIPAPVRSDMVARRLVAGALGMRSPRKTAEEVAEDKRKLQDAKDKIRAEQEQKTARELQIQAAWDA
ncbi:Coiled-coil domain-containing protein r3hcc1l [Geranomyces variabilis]|nr:Coiled-coil domain-containing protein r3hcc1l [Geranomyces variabilis]